MNLYIYVYTDGKSSYVNCYSQARAMISRWNEKQCRFLVRVCCQSRFLIFTYNMLHLSREVLRWLDESVWSDEDKIVVNIWNYIECTELFFFYTRYISKWMTIYCFWNIIPYRTGLCCIYTGQTQYKKCIEAFYVEKKKGIERTCYGVY